MDQIQKYYQFGEKKNLDVSLCYLNGVLIPSYCVSRSQFILYLKSISIIQV